MSLTSRRRIHGFCLFSIGAILGRWTVPATTVSAQVSPKNPGEIMFGTIPVRLRMNKDVVLATLRKDYKVDDSGTKVNGAEFWSVWMTDKIIRPIGNLQFRRDRVVDATREWGSIGQTTL